jgi:cyclic-di-AMP phosphodiesterase PgpH
MGVLNRYLRHPLRRALLQVLAWIETSAPPRTPRTPAISFWRRDVHLPTWLVAALVWIILFGALFLELGLGWNRVLGLFLLTGMTMALFVVYIRHEHPDILHDDEAVMLLGVLTVGSVVLMKLWITLSHSYRLVSPVSIPLASASLLTALLLKARLAIVFTVALSLIFGVIIGFSLREVLVTCLGGLTGVAASLHVRTRRDVTRAGLWVAVVQGLAVVALALLQGWTPRAPISTTWAAAGGLLSAVLALGLLSPLENFFSRLTNIKLLELSDVNHPLLKRMSLEAPGTYHHSLIMASLAEAAAESIGANGLLCRVGAYFHDIGKLVKPEYFVENQGALGNPHDPLPPNMSRLVIQSHVKEGVALGRQYGLDRAIIDFIPMHHGTSRIEYFYRRALSQRAPDWDQEVGEEEYRYPGPRPQSKETAIVMLADSVEASARTLEDPTHQRLKDQVQKIIDIKMRDGQFADVPLTLADIAKIAESFVNTLTGVYHSRIAYPEATQAVGS